MSNLWVPIGNLRTSTLPKDSAGDSIGDCSALAVLMSARSFSLDPKSITYREIAQDIIDEKRRNRDTFSDKPDFWFSHHCDVPRSITTNLVEKYTELQFTSIRPLGWWQVWEIAKVCHNYRLILVHVPDHIVTVKLGKIYDTWNSQMEPLCRITVPISDSSAIVESLRKYTSNTY